MGIVAISDFTDIYSDLNEEFENYVPNDEEFLEEYPDLVEEIDAINALNPTSEEEYKVAIHILYDFLNEWYPDSVDDADKEVLDAKLAAASAYLQAQSKEEGEK